MKYLFNAIYWATCLCIKLFLTAAGGIMITVVYVIWEFSIRDCPTLKPEFWFNPDEIHTSEWDNRSYKYTSFLNFLMGKKTYIDKVP